MNSESYLSVSPADEGSWVVRRAGDPKVLFSALQKQDAIVHACDLAKGNGETKVVVEELVAMSPDGRSSKVIDCSDAAIRKGGTPAA